MATITSAQLINLGPASSVVTGVTGIPTIASTTALLAGDGSGNAVAHTLTAAEIPSLDAAKITSGTITATRLPVATSASRGAVMPAAKEATMTQAVGVDANGALWTAAGGGGGGDPTGGFCVYIGSISSANLTQLNFADGTSEVLANGTHNKVWEHVVSLTLDWPSDVHMSGLSVSELPISFGGKVYYFGGGSDSTTDGFRPLGIGLIGGYVGTFPLTASMAYVGIYCSF